MEMLICWAVFFHFVTSVAGTDWTCYLDGYHQCDGLKKCCADGTICVNKDTCLAISAIVGICISAVIGIVALVVMIYVCKRQKKATVGTVFSTQPGSSAPGQQPYNTNTGSNIQPLAYGMQTYNTLPPGKY